MTVQLVTRIPEDLAQAIDALVADGTYTSRSEAVRAGIVDVIDRHRRRQIGEAIVEGYRRIPQEEDDGWRLEAAKGMIAEEPW